MSNAQNKNPSLLNLLEPWTKTCKTRETCTLVSNLDFIDGIFGKNTSDSKPIVVSFAGNPHTTKKSSWAGKPWLEDETHVPEINNNYVSFATFAPDGEGIYRRQKKNFTALYAVLLDDVGTKVANDRITLKPSWRIETSLGNFQVGYILARPITDAVEADRLVNSIIDAGLTDPGASGPCSRLGRLPVAMNWKSEWECGLVDWHPELKYSVNEIVDGLQIELKETAKRIANKSFAVIQNDDVHIPRSNENPVITALKATGRYKQPLGDGKHDITCPWVHEHTGGVDDGTAYFEPSETYPIGGFKCQHGHCSSRHAKALHEVLGISRVEAKHKPLILVQPGELPRICDAAEFELSKTLRHYQRSGVIVTINTDPGTRETSVKPLSLPSLTRSLSGIAIWQRFDKRADSWVVIDPPEKYGRIIFDATGYQHLPVLKGITRQPYLRADGSLMSNPGYDATTGMFGVFNPKHFDIPAAPTREQAASALTELSGLLDEFAFKTESDKAAALAAVLTAVVRPSLPQAPMFHVKAPSIASGKSYLCELLTAFATPQRGAPHSFPADDEEMRKLLLSELLTAPAVVEFDNLTSDLISHKSLCTVLTSEFIAGRILGQSKTSEVGTRALFLSSGNNVGPVRDMTRRVVTITLDPACETPAARDFKKQPVVDVRSNRGRFVSLALIVVRGWVAAGRPKSECKTIASYNDWSLYCRQSLLWLGLPDPAACIFEAMAADPDRDLLRQFLRGWHEKFGTRGMLLRDALKVINISDEELLDAVKEIGGERDGSINSRRLGWWIKRHAGRVVDGMRLVEDEGMRGTAKWKAIILSNDKGRI